MIRKTHFCLTFANRLLFERTQYSYPYFAPKQSVCSIDDVLATLELLTCRAKFTTVRGWTAKPHIRGSFHVLSKLLSRTDDSRLLLEGIVADLLNLHRFIACVIEQRELDLPPLCLLSSIEHVPTYWNLLQQVHVLPFGSMPELPEAKSKKYCQKDGALSVCFNMAFDFCERIRNFLYPRLNATAQETVDGSTHGHSELFEQCLHLVVVDADVAAFLRFFGTRAINVLEEQRERLDVKCPYHLELNDVYEQLRVVRNKIDHGDPLLERKIDPFKMAIPLALRELPHFITQLLRELHPLLKQTCDWLSVQSSPEVLCLFPFCLFGRK